ncbi:MAG: entericidin A/B family lipoprotein [Pseudomonadota bacterium]|nr:entericidin A/B family lipoprotein [Pseudomonadota bacterium]
MKRIPLLVLSLIALFSLCACNTIAGVGKDLEKGGEEIQKATGK